MFISRGWVVGVDLFRVILRFLPLCQATASASSKQWVAIILYFVGIQIDMKCRENVLRMQDKNQPESFRMQVRKNTNKFEKILTE